MAKIGRFLVTELEHGYLDANYYKNFSTKNLESKGNYLPLLSYIPKNKHVAYIVPNLNGASIVFESSYKDADLYYFKVFLNDGRTDFEIQKNTELKGIRKIKVILYNFMKVPVANYAWELHEFKSIFYRLCMEKYDEIQFVPDKKNLVIKPFAHKQIDLIPNNPLDDFKIGRSLLSTLMVKINFISDPHLVVRFNELSKKYEVTDLNSKNGSGLNGHKLIETMPLEPGCRIELPFNDGFPRFLIIVGFK